jgi:hypothetical protein
MELLSVISGALIGGSLTLLGTWLASNASLKQVVVQQRFQQEESRRKDRIKLYSQIMRWRQRIQLAFEYLAQAGDMNGFTETVRGSPEMLERFVPQLDLLGSTKVNEMFLGMIGPLGTFFKALREGEIHGEALAKLAVEADKCVRETMPKLKDGMRREIGVYD